MISVFKQIVTIKYYDCVCEIPISTVNLKYIRGVAGYYNYYSTRFVEI